MPSPKKVAPTNPNTVIDASSEANLKAGQETQGMNTIGQGTQYGNLNYTTVIDPITGLPKYQANSSYTPQQQQIFDYLQQNQTGIGGTASDTINNLFSQYGQDPNLVGQAGSLTNQALDAQMPAWERFNAPARDQQRTQLINQGLQEGSPAYQQQMDKLTQQQQLNQGQWLSNFQPQAFNEAQQQYELPLQNVAQMLGLSQPGNLQGSFTNTPQGNVGAADVTGAYNLAQQSQMFNAQQQNAYWNNIIGGGLGAGKAVMGMPTSSVGGNMIANAMK